MEFGYRGKRSGTLKPFFDVWYPVESLYMRSVLAVLSDRCEGLMLESNHAIIKCSRQKARCLHEPGR